MISHLKLTIEKLRRELYGQRSERTVRLIDQMELQLEDLEARASEDEIAAQESARLASLPVPAPRRRPVRKPFTEHLPRARRRAGADQLSLLRLDEAVERPRQAASGALAGLPRG